MNPLKVSAQFAAYNWFTQDQSPSATLNQDAWKFAQRNWLRFVADAPPGLGRLLLKLADQPCRDAPRRLSRAAARRLVFRKQMA